MAEGRDRLTRHEDPIDIYSRRRRSFARGGIGIFEDESPDSSSRAPAETGRMTAASIGYGGIGRIGFGSPRTRRGRQSLRTPTRVIGRQNISPAGQGRSRGRHSVLPAWYPRTPLRDITAIVRAIERTRARLRESEGEQLESILPQDHTVLDPSESTSGAPLEHTSTMITPPPRTRRRYHAKSVHKILLDITNQEDTSGASECLTPERKLLNSIDTVEKDVMEELHKLKRTPSARKEEREKRVKTLMSMR
ncbi:protein POLYCHOME [Capsicum galapagoense]